MNRFLLFASVCAFAIAWSSLTAAQAQSLIPAPRPHPAPTEEVSPLRKWLSPSQWTSSSSQSSAQQPASQQPTTQQASTPQQAALPEPTLYDPQVDIRNGGVLDESFGYHRQAQAHQSVRPGPYPPKGGWYGYGFPVSTYRWGWFGAEHYWPRVGWRSDYNGDRMRWAYRYGY